jgi:hypothetical protein
MPWDDIARGEYKRDCLRFPSDLTDREWALIALMLRLPSVADAPGRLTYVISWRRSCTLRQAAYVAQELSASFNRAGLLLPLAGDGPV